MRHFGRIGALAKSYQRIAFTLLISKAQTAVLLFSLLYLFTISDLELSPLVLLSCNKEVSDLEPALTQFDNIIEFQSVLFFLAFWVPQRADGHPHLSSLGICLTSPLFEKYLELPWPLSLS